MVADEPSLSAGRDDSLPATGAVVLSFVIPARNESRMLPATLRSISQHVGQSFAHEVIVVDHGSTDGTGEIARNHGAAVVRVDSGTIGHARNCGVSRARGTVLVFLDADVTLTSGWAEAIPSTLSMLESEPNTIAGSRCAPPDDSGWIGRAWFSRRDVDYEARHLGTGHLIIGRRLFATLGGFDETLETGEDYEFSTRAKARGGTIAAMRRLHVVHHGVPRTLGEFVRREAWHSRGDARRISDVLRSRVALLAVLFAVGHALTGILLVAQPVWPPIWAIPVLLVCAICVASAFVKYRGLPWTTVARNSVLFYFYFVGRFWGILESRFPWRSYRRGSRPGA